jgi:hypothetical protein
MAKKEATRPAQPGLARFHAALLPPDFASRSGKPKQVFLIDF